MQNKLADILDRGLKQTNSLMEFITWCETQQVYVEPHLQGDNIAGLVYEYQGVRFRGSDLGKGYAWLGITKKLVYDPTKDIATLRQRLALRQKPALRMTVMDTPRKKRDMKRRVQDADYRSKVQELFAESVRLDFSHDAIAIHFPEGGESSTMATASAWRTWTRWTPWKGSSGWRSRRTGRTCHSLARRISCVRRSRRHCWKG